MAVVNFYVQADMSNPTFFYGSITGYTSTSISLSDGVHSGTYSLTLSGYYPEEN